MNVNLVVILKRVMAFVFYLYKILKQLNRDLSYNNQTSSLMKKLKKPSFAIHAKEGLIFSKISVLIQNAQKENIYLKEYVGSVRLIVTLAKKKSRKVK
jgi:hypothetical protein